jgi:uncharacterized membrane protein YcfT
VARRTGSHVAQVGPAASRQRRRVRSGARVPAVDAGRGLAITLVVLLHAADWLQVAGLPIGDWPAVDTVAAALRMPLFFTISGVLGSKLLQARWPDLLAGRVTLLLWVYLAWQPIGSLVGLVVHDIKGDSEDPLRMLLSLALTPVRPRLELWFVWALALMFLIARLTRRVPVAVQLLVTGVTSAICLRSVPPVTNPGWCGLLAYDVFFLIGMHGRDLVVGQFDRTSARPWRALALVAAWAAVAVPCALFDLERFVGPGLAVRALGLAAGIAVAALLARSRLLRHLGSRTLPIYLAHTPIIIVLVRVIQVHRGEEWVHRLGPFLPLLVALAVVPLTLVLGTLLSATPARLLYEPPARLTITVYLLCNGLFRRSQGRRRHRPAVPDAEGGPPNEPVEALAVWEAGGMRLRERQVDLA